MASYCTPAQMLERKDAREIGDLVSDSNTQVSDVALLTDDNLLTALADASGDIEAALLVGGRYSVEDLENLTGNSANYLQRICAEIAMYYLLVRRPQTNADLFDHYDRVRERYLKTLKSGAEIFPLPETISATQPSVDGPTTQDYHDLNMIRDRVLRYFPRRHNPNNR